ncbi:MAG: hypothetical protein RL595_2707 [Planctomycetota bacterium]
MILSIRKSLGLLTIILLSSNLYTKTTCAEDWPQWMGNNRDGIWKEKGIVESFPANGLKKAWSTQIGGGYASPAIYKGKVFVADRILDSGVKDSENLFARANSLGKERLLCLDELTGKLLWEYSTPVTYTMAYPCGPRCSPLATGSKVFFLGAMGDLHCLNQSDGKLLWKKSFTKDYSAPVPIWGFAAHPLLVEGNVICLVSPKKVAVAFDIESGKENWSNLTLESPESEIGYCPPTLIPGINGQQTLVIWHSESVNGLDPKTGKLIWTHPFKLKANLSIPTPIFTENKLLVSSFYNGSRLLDLSNPNEAKLIWKGNGRGETPTQTDGLHAIMCTPVVNKNFIYGVCSYGQLRCIKLLTGERVWADLRATGNQKESVERWANAFITPHEDRYFLFNEKGDLIIAKLSEKGYQELSRTHLIEPTGIAPAGGARRKIVWSHPAFANKHIFVRNDTEICCFSLSNGN